MAKPGARFIGVDDGPHVRSDHTVRLVGVLTQGPAYVEAVLSSKVIVDGSDGTRRVAHLVANSRFFGRIEAVFLNGIFVGGFNLVDPERLTKRLGVPVIALVRSSPRSDRVRAALKAAFDDNDRRWRRVEALAPSRLPGLSLHATVAGANDREAVALVRAATVRGHLPECLRLAHVIASGIGRGESRGRA